MTRDDIVRIAQEALEGFIPYLPLHDKEQCDRYDKAIITLRQAIEQAQQAKPVAYSYTGKSTGVQGFSHHHPPRFTDVEQWDIVPLYTTPPQRKPLTPESVFQIADQHPVEGFDPDIMAFARAIEAAHGIKENT